MIPIDQIPNLPNEIWHNISEKIQDGSDWKSFVVLSKLHNEFNTDRKILQFSNPLWSFIKLYPNHDWNYNRISCNPCTTFDIVRQFPNRPYKYKALIKRLKFPLEFLEECVELAASFVFSDPFYKELYRLEYKVIKNINLLSQNPYLPGDFVEKYPNFNWDWSALSKHQDIRFILTHRYLPWNLNELCCNPTVTVDILDCIIRDGLNESIENDIPSKYWICFNPNLTLDFFKRYLQYVLMFDRGRQINVFRCFSWNPSITKEFIDLNPDLDWDWYSLCNRDDIISIFETYHSRLSNYNYLNMIARNPKFSMELVRKFPNLEWPNCVINKGTPDDIAYCISRGWNVCGILMNPEIPLRDLLKHFIMMPNGLIVYGNQYTPERLNELSQCNDIRMPSYYNESYAPYDYLSKRDLSNDNLDDYPEIKWDLGTLFYNPSVNWLWIYRRIELLKQELLPWYVDENNFKRSDAFDKTYWDHKYKDFDLDKTLHQIYTSKPFNSTINPDGY